MKLIDADNIRFSHGLNKDGILYVPYGEIKSAPTIDAKPVVHGYWKYSDLSEIAGRTWYECTCCGKLINIQYNYCPNCGAEMDEEVSDEAN